MILKILVTGYCVLIGAIFANIIAVFLNLETWYTLLKDITNSGFNRTLTNLSTFSYIWLFIIYPAILSISYKIGFKIYLLIKEWM